MQYGIFIIGENVAKNNQNRRNCRITVPIDYCMFPSAREISPLPQVLTEHLPAGFFMAFHMHLYERTTFSRSTEFSEAGNHENHKNLETVTRE
jgi:hypothetical protein